jgi:hypothetical protein
MGVSSTTNTEIYSGDGSTVSFSFPFYFFAQLDLYVYIYDTLLGGITTKTLGGGSTQFTISGTANAQGLYPSGANVVFGTAPLSTDVVVISRYPVEKQTFALLQNGVLPSVAIVQELDYLTLLIQSLQDQVNRCIQLPAGFGATFSVNLPSGMALAANENSTLIIDPTGSFLTFGPTATAVAGAQAAATAAAASATAAASSATTAAAAAASASTSATNAATSATAAAASATAAAASAASIILVTGSWASPTLIAAGAQIPATAGAKRELMYVQGNGAAITTGTPFIAAGTVDGAELTLIGTDNTKTVTTADGNGTGTKQNGGVTLPAYGSITYRFNLANSVWIETGRNGI